MSLLIEADPCPLRLDSEGIARIGPTRITLDAVIHAYREGQSPEEIVSDFDTLSLADVHATIAYYLRHQSEVDAYLQEQEARSDEIQHRLEARFDPHGIRDRLLARSQCQ